jgi:hypothetical protein
MAYFRLADSASPFRDLDGWLRRRLRQIHWKHWKTAARRHNLRIRSIHERNARRWGGSGKGYWRVAGSGILHVALPNTYWDRLRPQDPQPNLAASLPNGLTNRRMRARMSGGVSRGGATPPLLDSIRA